MLKPAAPSADPITGTQAALTALGPHFQVDVHDPLQPAAPPWLPLAPLLTSPAALRERAEHVRAALAAMAGQPTEHVDPRVAVSMTQLNIAGRLIAPVLGAAVVHGRLLDLRDARWTPLAGGPMPLSISRHALVAASAATAQEVSASVLDGPVATLVGSAARLSVSPKVLWGNVASALSAVLTMLLTARPELTDRITGFGAVIALHPDVRGAHTGALGRQMQRTSCCLIYRLDGSTLCPDCVLASSSDAHAIN